MVTDDTTNPNTPHDARPPLARIALGSVGAPAVIGGLFLVAATTQSDGLRSGSLGLAAALAGSIAGLAILAAAGKRPATVWPMMLLFASASRLLTGLFIAVPLYLVASPDKMSFWGVFLGAAITAIIGEVAAVAPFVRSLSPEPGGAPNTRHPSAPPLEARSA
jgi:hypothetical protein